MASSTPLPSRLNPGAWVLVIGARGYLGTLRSTAVETKLQSLLEIKYVTTINSTNKTDGGVDEKPKHYVTIFMRANVEPREGEEEVVAEVSEEV